MEQLAPFARSESRLSWEPSSRSAPRSVDFNCSNWYSENDSAHIVLTHDIHRLASAISACAYGTLTRSAQKTGAYDLFLDSVKKHGIRVVDLVDVILSGKETDPGFTDFLTSRLNVVYPETISFQDVKNFKAALVGAMTPEQIQKAVTHQMTIKLAKEEGSIVISEFSISPLLDLLAARVQLCTPKGLVLVTSEKYKNQAQVLEYCFGRLGFQTILHLPDPLHLSGTDYIPAHKELCLIGTGLLTDEAAARYVMSKDAFGTPRVAIIRDLFDRSPDRPSLDSVMKIISKDCIIVLEDILGYDNINRRLVNEYIREGPKTYSLNRMNIELEDYLRGEGFKLIKFPHSLYKKYGMGIYNLGEGNLMVAHSELKEHIEKHPEFTGKIEVLSFQGDYSAYSWIGTCSLIFRRPSPEAVAQPIKEILVREVAPWGTQPGSTPLQATDTILMVAPVGFQTNVETAMDNYFMKKTAHTPEQIERMALQEFSALTRAFANEGVKIVLYSSERFHQTPDAVFPNNWFSTHSVPETKESTVVFYPMKTPSRRNERRQNIVSEFQAIYEREYSFIQWETADFPHFLESTGVLIKDRVRKIAYAALSQRCYSKIASTWAEKLGYRMVFFHASDLQGRPIYHTNVMMSVGTSVAVVCLESVENLEERRNLVETLSQSHAIVQISREQTNEFCGNVLEVRNKKGERLLAMSTRAYDAFTEEQRATLLKHVDKLIHTPIPIIETIGGGGVRCMMGEIF